MAAQHRGLADQHRLAQRPDCVVEQRLERDLGTDAGRIAQRERDARLDCRHVGSIQILPSRTVTGKQRTGSVQGALTGLPDGIWKQPP